MAPAPRTATSPMFALRNWRFSSSAGGIIGLRRAPLPPHEADAEQDRHLHEAEPAARRSPGRTGSPRPARGEAERRRRRAAACRARRRARPALRSQVSGHQRSASTTPTMPNGMLMRKIQCQLATLDQHAAEHRPERRGRRAPPPRSARGRGRAARAGRRATVIAKPSGARMPAPTPWSARKPISQPIYHAAAHRRRADR